MEKGKNSISARKIIVAVVGIVLLLFFTFLGKSVFPDLSDLHLRTIEKLVLTITIFCTLFLEIREEKSRPDNNGKVKERRILLLAWLIISVIMIVKDYI